MNNRALWGLVACVLAHAGSAFADAKCGEALTALTRNELAKAYSCNINGNRCIDGHVGRVFVDPTTYKGRHDGGYIEGDRYYEPGRHGASVTIKVFVRKTCANDRLRGLVFKTDNIKNIDSTTEGTPSSEKNQGGDDDKSAAKKSVADTKADVKSNVNAAFQDIAKKAEALCTASTSCKPQLNKFTQDTQQLLSADGSKPDRLFDLAEGIDKDTATRLRDEANKRLASTAEQTQKSLEDLQKQLNDKLAGDSRLAQVKATLAHATQNARDKDWAGVQAALDSVDDVIDPNPWPSTKVGTDEISVRDYSVKVPSDDDVAFFTVTTSDVVKDAEDKDLEKPIWPRTTMTVKVDHGDYHWDFGYMFAGVHNGDRETSGADRSCPNNCGWASQSMLTGTVYFKRKKFVTYSNWNLIPGLQVGLNVDLTKIADAISAGLVLEPIKGLGVSAGAMFYSRNADKPMNADGSQPKEHVFIPYIGVTVNSKFLETIKNLGNGGDKKGNAEDEKGKK